MGEPFRVSNSSLSAVSVCSVKAVLQRVHGLTSPGAKVAAFAGSAFHRVLKGWFGGEFVFAEQGVEMMKRLYKETADREVRDQEKDRLRWENVEKCVFGYLEQNAPIKFPFKFYRELLEVEVGKEGTVGYPIDLDGTGRFTFHGILDAVAQDEKTGALYLVDHKTTGWLSSLWAKQFRRGSQLTGYLWLVGKLYPTYQVGGAWINAIELSNLPSDPERKCKLHKTSYSECGKHHLKFELIGPSQRTPFAMEEWRFTAVKLSEKLKWLFDNYQEVEKLVELPAEGIFTGGCAAYGGCDFVDFCDLGRRESGIEQLLVKQEKEID